MKKTLSLFIIILLYANELIAQIPVTDGANAGLNAANLKVNSATMNASIASKGFLETAKKVAEKTYDKITDLKDAAEGLLAKTEEYQKALKSVNSYVANSSNVKRCFETEKMIVKHYYESLAKYGPKLRGDDQRFYRTILRNGLQNSARILDDLTVVLKPSFYSMTDKERLSEIDAIHQKLKRKLDGQKAFVDVIEAYTSGTASNQPLKTFMN